METSLRILLLLAGVIIVGGILWDSFRDKRRKKLGSKRRERPLEKDTSFVMNDDLEDMDDVVLVSKKSASSVNTESTGSELIILNIMARQPGVFLGKRLFDALNEAHIFYGEMDIFHRYENLDGTGETVFSLASVVEPGVFVLSKLDTFSTPGITLFFKTTKLNQSIAAFELMLRTAKQLAARLDGELKDDQRRPLTEQAIENYRDRVRGHRVIRKTG